MSWTTFTLRVQTPLFSGDDPGARSGDSPIRVPSIRGVLRYWFRAVAAGHGITDQVKLWEEEQAVFGSTDKPSPIRLRVNGSPPAAGAGTKPDWAGGEKWGGFHGAHYLLGQGLWHYRNGLTRPYVEPDSERSEFELEVRLSDDDIANHRFLLAMWAWLTYGGLGARTRRGFGRLRCVGISDALPGQFRRYLTTEVSEDAWQALAGDVIPEPLRGREQTGFPAWITQSTDTTPLPPFPALCPAWWGAAEVVRPQREFDDAMNIAGRVWRNFRSNATLTHRPSQDDHSPEWTNAIHGEDRRYPIAAFGLPVGYYSTKSKAKAEVNPVLDGDTIRRASPVWFLPARLPNGTWFVLTHAFWARLLPGRAALKVTGNIAPTEVDVPDARLARKAWDNWLDQAQRLPDDFYSR